MERLTIKELAPYLPYELKLLYQDDICYLDGISSDSLSVVTNDGGEYVNIIHVKPILRPLSQLTEEIEHNGERFVPMVEIKNSEYYSHYELEDFVRNSFSYGSLNSLSYQLITKLHEWHFDVFGLIDRGIALPIDGKELKP